MCAGHIRLVGVMMHISHSDDRDPMAKQACGRALLVDNRALYDRDGGYYTIVDVGVGIGDIRVNIVYTMHADNRAWPPNELAMRKPFVMCGHTPLYALG